MARADSKTSKPRPTAPAKPAEIEDLSIEARLADLSQRANPGTAFQCADDMEDHIRRAHGLCDAIRSVAHEISEYDERLAHAIITLARETYRHMDALEEGRCAIWCATWAYRNQAEGVGELPQVAP